MSKPASVKPVSNTGLSSSHYKTWRTAIVTGVVVLAAIGARVHWQQQANHGGSAAVNRLAMDDSAAELPLNPPVLPADNAAQFTASKTHVDTLANSASVEDGLKCAQAALKMGDLWRAEITARTLQRQDPQYRLAQLTLASSLRQQARFHDALQIYKQLLTRDGRDSDAYLGLADTTFAANQRPQAFEWLARGLKDGAQTSIALTAFAHRYQDWKDFPKGEETAAHAVQIDPNDVDALLEEASIQVESGKLDAGRQTLDTIFKKDAANGFAYRLMGVVLMNASYAHQDINRARTLLEQAVGLSVKDPDIYRALALIYRQQHLYRLAAQAYDALLHLQPASLDGRYGLGQVYALLGKPGQSQKQLALYKQLDERQQRATRLQEDAAHHPQSAQIHDELAHLMQSSGDYAGALPQYQTAAGLAPDNAAIWNDLMQFYARVGWPPPKQIKQ